MHEKHTRKSQDFSPSQFPFITRFRESAVDVLLGGKPEWACRAGSSPADPGARPARRGPSWSSHRGWRSRLSSTLKPHDLVPIGSSAVSRALTRHRIAPPASKTGASGGGRTHGEGQLKPKP